MMGRVRVPDGLDTRESVTPDRQRAAVRAYAPFMRQKKLLSVACAVGILACGACFLPPPKPPPPPLPPDLTAVRAIAVQVEDATTDNPFDSETMSAAVTKSFNSLWAEFPVRAIPFPAARQNEALLTITIHRKTVSCKPSNGKLSCGFELISSFTLTAADGKILESKSEESSRFGLWLNAGVPPGAWNSNPYRHQAAYALAMSAGFIFDPDRK